MAGSESSARKAEQLRRSIARGDFASARRLLDSHRRSPGQGGAAERPAAVSLEEACPGAELTPPPPAGQAGCYRIRPPLAGLAPHATAVAAEYLAVMRGARERFDELGASRGLCCAAGAAAEDVLFCKIECTCQGKDVFLVGLMSCADERLLVEQLLARGDHEEPAVLRAVAGRLPAAGVLATYRGRASEVKRLADRAAARLVDWPRAKGAPEFRMPVHLDLRAEAARRWRGQVPSLGLRALEELLCRRQRRPASPAPSQAYLQFLATGDAGALAGALRHNALDLLTMAQLLTFLLTGCDPLDG